MKRQISVFLAITILLTSLLFASCSTTEPVSDEPIVITLWHYYNGSTKDNFDALVLDFNETKGNELGIIVDAYAYSSVPELAEAVLASGQGEVGAPELPDIFASYSDNAYQLDSLGVIANLTPYFTEEELSLYRSEFLEEGRFDSEGNLKIIPVAKSSEILYINHTDLLPFLQDTSADINMMSTWEGLSAIAEQYYNYTDDKTTAPNDGKALFGVDSTENYFIITSKQLGEDIYMTDSGELGFNVSEEYAKKIWDYLYTPYLKGHYAAYGRFRSDDIKSGDLISYVGSTASTFYFPKQVEKDKDSAYDIECITMPYPYFEGGEKIVVQQGAGMLVSKSDETREDAAVEFLKWFTLPENNMEFAVSTGYMPVQVEALNYEDISALITAGESPASAVVSAAETIYTELLTNYTLYTNKPFENSYSARLALGESMSGLISTNTELLNQRVLAGESREDVIAELISEDEFARWYDGLKAVMGEFGLM